MGGSMRRLAGPLIVLVLVASLAIAPSSGDASFLPFQKYKIGSTKYYSTDVLSLARRIPRLPGSLSLVLGLLDRCRGLGTRAYIATSPLRGGIVAYAPHSISDCLTVSGGGPGGPGAFQPCILRYVTAPTGQYYAIVAATDEQTCVDLSTEVPGGMPVRTTTALANGFPAGSDMVVKCQRQTRAGLVDYVAPPVAVPASRPAFWVDDYYVTPHGPSAGVPYC
jgi:hypothetical protein